VSILTAATGLPMPVFSDDKDDVEPGELPSDTGPAHEDDDTDMSLVSADEPERQVNGLPDWSSGGFRTS
jgi:hypothetical protein